MTDQEVLERSGLVVTEEMKRHSLVGNVIYLVGTGWTVAVCWILLRWRVGARIARHARSSIRGRFPGRVAAAAAIFTIFALMLFPLELTAGFLVPHAFELSNESFGAWLWDGIKGFFIATGVGSVLAALAFSAIDAFPRNWWLVLWAASVPLTLAIVFIAPVLVAPLFNDFEPLEDRGLERRLISLAEGVGIEGSRVYQVDKSKQTRTMNAYVTGLGSTKRIVIWDTLLEKMEEDEVVFVMAHEMGHYVLRHLWKGIAFTAAVSFVLYGLGSIAISAGVRRNGERWGVTGVGDIAILPWALLVATLLGFLSSPVLSAMSRHIEHEADLFALEHTGMGEPGARAFAALAEGAKVDPSPHPLVELWRYSHPPLIDRMRLALSWDQQPASPI